MAEWKIEPFASNHDRSNFSCGRPTLDEFLLGRVSQYEKRRIGKTFVAVPPEGNRVIGYYTLAAGAVYFENLPIETSRKLPKHPVPVVLLARLAVDQSMQGKGMGEGLLLDAIQRSLKLSGELGIHAVKVEALDSVAAGFYRKYGFIPLLDNPLHLFLPLSGVEPLFG